MKTRLFYLPLLLFLLSNSIALGQTLSIKNSSGNGPILSSLKITNVEAAGNILAMGSMLRTPTTGSDEVDVRFYLSGKITQYRYNGRIYKSKYPDCSIFCGDCENEKVKVTATIKAGGKTVTRTSGELIGIPGKHHFLINLPDMVKRSTIALVSLVIEPVPYPDYEAQLDKLKKCKEEKEKKEKEKEKKETTTADDDWWNGKDEKPGKRKIVLNTSDADWWNGADSKEEKPVKENVSDADWWNGENETSNTDKQKQNAFRVVNNYSHYSSKNEGKYSWVEDADGNIIIPKGKYYIESYVDGLAQVKILIRTDYYDFVSDKKVQLFEYCFMDENGNKLSPKTYGISYGHFYNPFTLYSSKMTRAEIDESKRRNKAKDKSAYQQLKSIYRGQGYDID